MESSLLLYKDFGYAMLLSVPIKEYVGRNKGNPRAGNDASSKTRTSKRAFKFYDVKTGDPIGEDTVVKAPAGTPAIDLTPAIHNAITDLVAQGNFLTVAVKAAGVSKATFTRWMDRASAFNQQNCTKKELMEMRPFINLMNDVATASAQAESDRVKIIKDAGTNGSWSAAGWWLERRHSERWAKKQLVSHSGEVVHSHEVAQKILADPTATKKAIDIFESVTESDG